MRKVIGVLFIVFALTLAVVPWFTDCASHGRELKTADGRSVPMKCHWAGIAELGAAVPMALMGIFAMRKQTSKVQIGLMGLSASTLAILFPTAIIGVCANAMMPCNMLMRPILLTAGTLAGVASLVILFSGIRAAATQTSLVAA